MRNRLVDLCRGEDARRRAGLVDLPEDILAEIAEASGIDVHDSLVRGEIEDALETAIEALPERQQEVLRAQAIEGITFRELSVRTGVPIDTLMALKRRAIKKIAAALEYWMEDV
jgi:RNA polymerase sigma factor (sigma-70 family)